MGVACNACTHTKQSTQQAREQKLVHILLVVVGVLPVVVVVVLGPTVVVRLKQRGRQRKSRPEPVSRTHHLTLFCVSLLHGSPGATDAWDGRVATHTFFQRLGGARPVVERATALWCFECTNKDLMDGGACPGDFPPPIARSGYSTLLPPFIPAIPRGGSWFKVAAGEEPAPNVKNLTRSSCEEETWCMAPRPGRVAGTAAVGGSPLLNPSLEWGSKPPAVGAVGV